MSRDLYLISVTVHVTAAVFWLGGMFFLGVIGAPLLRTEDPLVRRRLFHALGVRFRSFAWVALAVMVVTGLLNAWQLGYLSGLGDPAFRSTTTGNVFIAKLALVVLMLLLAALHDFWLGPRVGRLDPTTPEAARMRRLSSWIARVNALLALALIYVAVRLARGG